MVALKRIIWGFIYFLPIMAGSASNNNESLRESLLTQNWSEVISQSRTMGTESSVEKNKDLYRLVEAIALHRQGKIEESIKTLESIQESSLYYAWAKIFINRLAFLSQNFGLLKTSLQSIEKLPLKGEIGIEKQFYEAHLLMENQKWNPAMKSLQKIERKSRRSDLHVPILEALVLSEAKAQKLPWACKSLIKIYQTYPLHHWFDESAPEIKNISIGDRKISCAVSATEFDIRRRRLNILGEVKKGGEEMNRWFTINKTPLKDQKIMMAQQLIAEGQIDEGLNTLKAAQEGQGDLKILIPLSYAAAKAGDMKLAIDSSLAISKALKNSSKGAAALYQAGIWAYQIRDYENAEARLKNVPPFRLSSANRKELKWYQGWLRYLKGDFVGAERGFRSMMAPIGKKKKGAVESPDRVQYWLAMSVLKQEKREKAQVLFQKLASRSSINYYSILAKERLNQIKGGPSPSVKEEPLAKVSVVGRGAYFTPYGEDAPRPNAEDAAVTEEAIESGEAEELTSVAEGESSAETKEDDVAAETDESNVVELFSQNEANQKLERAKAFWSVGLEDLARREVGDLERFSKGFDLFKKVIEEYRQMGLYNKLTVMGHAYAGRANYGSNKFIYESMFPKAWAEQVEKYSAENNVPAALIWGIMKAESMFQPWVKSSVGALGLMQVMPSTGQKLAEMMGLKNFTPEILLEPPNAIRYGSKYLERLSKKFELSVPLVAAAYNAGPHRVSQWLYYFGYMQMDEWVEHIPFQETRNYVKKVTVNYMAYSALYGKSLGEPLALIDPVPVQIAGRPETKETWD